MMSELHEINSMIYVFDALGHGVSICIIRKNIGR